MQKNLQQINKLINELPERDIELAKKFYKEREFTDLLDLVNSAIIVVNKNKLSSNPSEKYINIDVDNLIMLKAYITDYISYL
jgi:hypothetical protein